MMNALHVLGVGLDFLVGGSINRLLVKLVMLGEISDFGDFSKIYGWG